MMSLKPRNVDFQETWAKLKETVLAVVALRPVERAVWNARFSDVYALCVAHPEPLADRLYDETKAFLEEHVRALLLRVKGNTPLDSDDPEDGFIDRYVSAWNEYSQGVSYLNCLYTYLNLQHVKRQKVSDAEIIYGSAASVACPEQELRQLEVGELGLDIWERVMLGAVGDALSARVVAALAAARGRAAPASPGPVAAAVASTVAVRAFRVRAPLALYQRLVLEPYLAAAGAAHARLAATLLLSSDVPQYMRQVLSGLERETCLARAFLHPSSLEAARGCYETAAVAAHLARLHAEVPRLVRAAAAEPSGGAARGDLRRMFLLLRPLGAAALRPLLEAVHEQAREDGRAAVDADHSREDAHVHFVTAMLALHDKYTALVDEVFGGAQAFIGALDKACSAVVNARSAGECVARAPELLARYTDTLLRKKGSTEGDIDEKLSAAIVVFKYVDDKDVFQKFYARALARRLIHQLSASMEQEEAMINKLKAACGYEFTNKLHRMFTDIAVSADLNAKFQRELRAQEGGPASPASPAAGGPGSPTASALQGEPGFTVQVLQAGAWPLGGAMAPVAPPPAIEKWARLFEAFYRAAFSGRRLAWLHHLCTGELRTRFLPRVYHLTCSVAQAALLLAFDARDVIALAELQARAALPADAFARQLRPLLDQGLLKQVGEEVHIELGFSCRRTKVRLALAGGGPGPAKEARDQGPGAAGPKETGAPCDEDRKMYLQAAIVRVCKQRKVVRHAELVAEVCALARHSFAPTTIAIKKCIEALIDKQYLERTPHAIDTYSYLA